MHGIYQSQTPHLKLNNKTQHPGQYVSNGVNIWFFTNNTILYIEKPQSGLYGATFIILIN